MAENSPRTDNDFLLGGNGETISPFLPIAITSREQAYRTAAWIKALGAILPHEEQENTYEEIERAIFNT